MLLRSFLILHWNYTCLTRFVQFVFLSWKVSVASLIPVQAVKDTQQDQEFTALKTLVCFIYFSSIFVVYEFISLT